MRISCSVMFSTALFILSSAQGKENFSKEYEELARLNLTGKAHVSCFLYAQEFLDLQVQKEHATLASDLIRQTEKKRREYFPNGWSLFGRKNDDEIREYEIFHDTIGVDVLVGIRFSEHLDEAKLSLKKHSERIAAPHEPSKAAKELYQMSNCYLMLR